MTEASSATATPSTQGADAAMTAEREETKFLVDRAALPALTDLLEARLAPHRFTGEAANRLPLPEHFVSTIYFDTEGLSYFEAAKHDRQHNLKIRAKEYYDLHPSLAELATDPEQIVRYQPWLWFELKRRDGAVTSKRRFRFLKAAAATLFDGGPLAPGLLSSESSSERADAQALVEHVRSRAERVLPSAIVNYKRLSYQNDEATLRVTVDVGLAFFAVPKDVFRLTRPLSRSELGKPAGGETRAVVEVKRRAALPEWLATALSRAAGGAVSFSKFVAASGAVHGR